MSCSSNPTLATDGAVGVAEGAPDRDVRVVAFLCNWCSYAGADKAGSSQLPVPPELSAIRVMCSGRVEPTLVLEAFEKGADGVLVLACHPGDCHYKEGNLRAFLRAEIIERLIGQLGINPARFSFDYVSAAEAERYSEITTSFVETIKRLDRLPVRGGSSAADGAETDGHDRS
jgi:coenzyme F420-reducing hydrogenase delta subunit